MIATMLLGGTLLGQGRKPTITVFKDPSCTCCDKWIQHLMKSGFDVVVKEVGSAELRQVKGRYGIPPALQSCHTGIVDGYVIEGHVPAAEVQRLLKERPKNVGLVVPGMPTGSPGMEGQKNEAYSVLALDSAGRTSIFRTYPASR